MSKTLNVAADEVVLKPSPFGQVVARSRATETDRNKTDARRLAARPSLTCTAIAAVDDNVAAQDNHHHC
jgi:hypothetical protein